MAKQQAAPRIAAGWSAVRPEPAEVCGNQERGRAVRCFFGLLGVDRFVRRGGGTVVALLSVKVAKDLVGAVGKAGRVCFWD